ncbi:bifunctional ornithine acetyltransferase/N-acetylglutamate synthase [Alkalilimnicola ehrlichii]|uniref:Arginine biosynthesis bifunctional protein ArgJ n=1 Tax=Alkalilimnicola ehrlichii TaxID=351052 RepID=A0A3E0X0T7_9GAMM|nr:bifunctional glutamate N-acetyltransferase/amino-acid acetyltransferase ArgJ [Alkalilimnicola ehrlichii]RFA30332.1 bifunctional ornithine acetyltransferase/N-acetylglutamate synthase [Alkalilimnicola ehrlichii]RFA37906.1 bifunctional ornithine acetyltransferase/N-acetylglutamate synthase [Alkalilimnicola ehrlichii]
MAVGYQGLPELMPVAGVRLATVKAGIKKPDRRDLVLFELAPDTQCAAVFTQNRFCAAPVQVAKQHLSVGRPGYLLINTGYANAGTGERGLADAIACCTAVAEVAGCEPERVLPFSTGVIGEPLPVERIKAAVPALLAELSDTGWAAAAEGIMTTDTVPKAASRTLELGGQRVTLTGVSKGAGMIRPNMATMLSFVATDAAVAPELLDSALREAVAVSFNRITVDGDTSTNDALLLLATGRSGASVIDAENSDYRRFVAALTDICIELAQAIVRDGEGATKFIAVKVEGAETVAEAEQVAFTVAESPLVKTALFAADPNWGRILAAIGRAGVDDLAVERVRLYLDDLLIADKGGRVADYDESAAAERMAKEELTIGIRLERGSAEATVWTCDFSYDYVRINADYRT